MLVAQGTPMVRERVHALGGGLVGQRERPGVPEGAGTTEWSPDVGLTEGTYWWRAYADDGTTRSRLPRSRSCRR